ncbi:hypothetical protein ElyMa_005091800 [Elysia marginata]|uniref:Uncharacterized protein n=1 Tax=Elysia marginata TaxID=1093978 RepID=A0AAV4JJV0_9GAST|nr:hypothetical protein ElyMa_005091800 [Elysia marginata]
MSVVSFTFDVTCVLPPLKCTCSASAAELDGSRCMEHRYLGVNELLGKINPLVTDTLFSIGKSVLTSPPPPTPAAVNGLPGLYSPTLGHLPVSTRCCSKGLHETG